MLIDEYSDFEWIVRQMTANGSGCQRLVARDIGLQQPNARIKGLCESIELSNVVKIYFEPYLAKKFV